MFELRAAHDRACRDPAFPEPDPRPELSRLAERFPGALREIDRLPLEVIASRIGALAAVEAAPERAEPWMVAQIVFHRHARGALAAKRWLAGRRAVTPDLASAFAAAMADDDALLFAEALEAVAAPPRGRLMDVVYARVAHVLDVSVAEARALVLPSRRR